MKRFKLRNPHREAAHQVMILLLTLVSFALIQSACSKSTPPLPGTVTPPPGPADFSPDLDLSPVALGPGDVSDLFPATTYYISQILSDPNSKGLKVTYPTETLSHETDFKQGFSTSIEIFTTTSLAMKHFDALIQQQTGKNSEMEAVGDASKAFQGPALTPGGADLGSTEYVVLFRESNAVVQVVFRTENKISSARLVQAAQTVLARLRP